LEFKQIFRGFLILLLVVKFSALGIAADQKSVLKFEKGDTLEQLRAKIKSNGYRFKVSHNWVYDMSPEEKSRFYGRRSSSPAAAIRRSDDLGPLLRYLDKQALPSRFDWRNQNGRAYIGPVRDQGYCGSCYAFGAAAAAEGTYNVAMNRFDGNCIDLSESFIMWCLGSLSEYNSHFFGCDGADYDYMELEALCEYGIVRESDYPYSTNFSGTCTHWDDPVIKFNRWFRIPCGDIDAIKTAIMTFGVVDAAVLVTSAFEAYDSGVYQDSNTSCFSNPCYYTPTNHAIALVGWDDADGVFILRNSWGSYWGENGYMRIKYNSAIVACEACYLTIDDIVLQLGVSREEVDMWVFNKEYADIDLKVDKNNNVNVQKYLIYKKEAGGTYQILKEIPDSELQDNAFSLMDEQLEPGRSYTYKAVALDPNGIIIGHSTEVNI
jgi:C1A family cysteine protease